MGGDWATLQLVLRNVPHVLRLTRFLPLMNLNWTVSLSVLAERLLRFKGVAVFVGEQLGEAQRLVLRIADDNSRGRLCKRLLRCEGGGTGREQLLVWDGRRLVKGGDF